MKILFIGDIFGRPGRTIVKDRLPELRKHHAVDLVIANCENAAAGFGITPQLAEELFNAKAFKEAVPVFEEYVRKCGGDTTRERIKLAIIYVKSLRRPKAALKMLARVDSAALPEHYRSASNKVIREAQKMIADGVTDQ